MKLKLKNTYYPILLILKKKKKNGNILQILFLIN